MIKLSSLLVEGTIAIHQEDKLAISKYIEDMSKAVKNVFSINKSIEANKLVAFMNETSKDLPSNQFPFEIEYVFYGKRMDGWYEKNKVVLVVGGSSRWEVGYDYKEKHIIFNCVSVNFKKLEVTFIHEFVHYIQDVYRQEKSGDYSLPSDWSAPGKYHKRGWERQAFGIDYLQRLRQKLDTENPSELILQLRKMGLSYNKDLDRLKKSDYKSWKAIMKQAIMAAVADIENN